MGGYENLSDEQISTIEAIVCVVESGRTDKYDAIATMKGDTGGLSFGRHQASMGSGNLFKLVKAYCDAPGAAWADELTPYLKKLEEKNVALNTDPEIKKLLRSAGADPVMVDVQDKFFFDAFMLPALKRWKSYGFESALSAAVIYDSYIHGNFDLIAKRVPIEPKADTERSWVKDYLEKRYTWLSTHSNTLLHATAIRIEALQQLAEQGNWTLSLPFDLKRPSSHYPMTVYDLPARCFASKTLEVDGVNAIQRYKTGETFTTVFSRKKSGAAPGNQRDIFIQRGLIAAGFMQAGTADGDFGTGTEVAIKKFQKQLQLKDNSGGIGRKEYEKLCEAIEVGALAIDPDRADSGLKPAPPVDDKRVTIGGTVIAAGGAAATAAGSVALGGAAADSAASDAKAADASATAGASTTPVVETPPATVPETGPATTTPATSADPAPATPTQPDQAQPGATTPAAPSQTTSDAATKAETPITPPVNPKGKLCARTDAFTSVPFTNCTLSKTDAMTIGAATLFIVAVGLFIFGRRIFDRSNK